MSRVTLNDKILTPKLRLALAPLAFLLLGPVLFHLLNIAPALAAFSSLTSSIFQVSSMALNASSWGGRVHRSIGRQELGVPEESAWRLVISLTGCLDAHLAASRIPVTITSAHRQTGPPSRRA